MVNFEIENSLSGIIAGCDEAGRGPIAGPVVGAATSLKKNIVHKDVNDSKKISPQKRKEIFEFISQNYHFAYSAVENEEIDKINILQASKKAMRTAVLKLGIKVDNILIDGNQKINFSAYEAKEHTIVKGDSKSYLIACASILAKVKRDEIMDSLHQEFPHYGWQKNKGYPTKLHLEAIKKHGICKYHRLSFMNLRNFG